MLAHRAGAVSEARGKLSILLNPLWHDRAMSTAATHTEHGDRGIAMAGEILRTVVGSGVHGIAIAGTDDHDEMGVYVEPPAHVIGLHKQVSHYVFRTQPEGTRSGPGDTDLVMYSLRKYLRLATKGNPTALLPLFAPPEAVLVLRPLGEQLRELAPQVLSQRAVRRFLGYMSSQRERLVGRGGRSSVPNRPELVARYGYDVKYASHALRLAYQGLEIASHGRLTLPMPEPERERVLQVKRGDVTELGDVLREIDKVEVEIEALLAAGRTPLPADPDLEGISDWSTNAHRVHWGWT
jgi:predicted nucleotidyltransferase